MLWDLKKLSHVAELVHFACRLSGRAASLYYNVNVFAITPRGPHVIFVFEIPYWLA